MNGVTMSCNTGDNTMAAVSEKYPFWTVEAVSQDTTMMTALKQAMKYQNYALANSTLWTVWPAAPSWSASVLGTTTP